MGLCDFGFASLSIVIHDEFYSEQSEMVLKCNPFYFFSQDLFEFSCCKRQKDFGFTS
jgi:hypothetical protein